MEIGSGVTLVDLACSGINGVIAKPGWIVNIVGDSNAGKSFLARTILADNYYKHREKMFYIYDDLEYGVHWNDAEMFGTPFAEHGLEPAFTYEDRSVEAWYANFNACYNRAIKEGRSFLYVLDSWDSLNSSDDIAYMQAVADGKDKKSMGMAKAKFASKVLADVVDKLSKSNSVLFIISQTRDNVNPMSFETRVRSGGKALQFYSSLEVWLSNKGKLKLDTASDPYGIQVGFRQRRSRLLGHEVNVSFPITYVYGIDNTQANIDYLVSQEVITKQGQSYTNETLGITARTREYASAIEKNGKTKELEELVCTTWLKNLEETKEKILRGRETKYSSYE